MLTLLSKNLPREVPGPSFDPKAYLSEGRLGKNLATRPTPHPKLSYNYQEVEVLSGILQKYQFFI
jgi:hypothetical protein